MKIWLRLSMYIYFKNPRYIIPFFFLDFAWNVFDFLNFD